MLLMRFLVMLMHAQHVVVLELDQFALCLREEHRTHEARNSQLLHYLKQVDLCVQLLQALIEQPFAFGGSSVVTAPEAWHIPEAALAVLCTESLSPTEAEHLPSIDCCLYVARHALRRRLLALSVVYFPHRENLLNH